MFNGSKTICLLCALLLFRGYFGDDNIEESTSIPRLNLKTHVIPAANPDPNYEIKVSLPSNYDANRIYPAVYVLDAYRNFEYFVLETALLQEEGSIPPVILVGISYDGIQAEDFETQRIKDLSIPLTDIVEQQMKKAMPFFQEMTLGGGGIFLHNIRTTIIPEIESIYKIDSTNRTLSGNSIGGLFAVYTLVQKPNLFKNFIIGSPSLWWGSNQIFTLMKENESLISKQPDQHIFLAVGSLEQEPENEWFQMIDNVKKLETNLLEIPSNNFQIHTEIIKNQTHGSMPSIIGSKGMLWVFGKKD